MTRFLPCVLVIGLAASVGCNRQQPATPAIPKGNTGDPVITPEQPGGKVPSVVQQPITPIPPDVQGPKVELGDSERRPVLFFELRTGMVIRVSDIKYGRDGSDVSCEASVQPDKGKEVKVLVRTETPPAGGMAPTFAASANGEPVLRQCNKNLVGFSVKDIGGVVLAPGEARRPTVQTMFSFDPTGRQDGFRQVAQQDGKTTFVITTKFSFTPTGRRYLAQQDVQHEGKTFAIAYSDYRWEESGLLAGYTARVVKAE